LIRLPAEIPFKRFDLKPYAKCFYASVLIISFLCSFPKIGGPITTGLNSSFQFAFNYSFSKNIQIGKDIIFTYGPLGFFAFPQPIGENLLLTVIVVSFLKFAFLMAFLYLHFLIKKPNTLLIKLEALVILAIVSFLTDLGFTLIFFTATLLLLHEETRNTTYVVFAIVLSSFSILVKSSFGIVSILLVLSYGVLDSFQRKDIKRLILTNSGVVVSFVLGWLVIYRNLSGIGDYLHGTLELSVGNSSAMTINPKNNWFILSIFFMLCLSLPFYIREKKVFILYGMFFLPLFAFFKYAFSREDHIYLFYFFIIHFYCLLFVCLRKIRVRVFVIVAISLLAFFANMKYVKMGIRMTKSKIFAVNGPSNFKRIVLNFDDYEKNLFVKSKTNLRTHGLEESVMRTIGAQPVDIYPWETSFILANDLNWQPRPIFQSFVAYTPWLDRQNALFFDSHKSPKYIIWEVDHWRGEVSSIDERYLLNDEPLTIYAILNHYKLIHRDKQIALLERVFINRLKEPRLIGSKKGHWAEWIEVPPLRNGMIRARVDVSRKMIGSLKRLLYKEEEFFIEYRLENGDIKKYRLVIDNAVSGVWVNPLIVRISTPFQGLGVKEIRLSHSRSDFLKREIGIEWELIEPLNNETFFELHH
jgi:hypothetical protein